MVVGFKASPKGCIWEPWEESITNSHPWTNTAWYGAPAWELVNGQLTIEADNPGGWQMVKYPQTWLELTLAEPFNADTMVFRVTSHCSDGPLRPQALPPLYIYEYVGARVTVTIYGKNELGANKNKSYAIYDTADEVITVPLGFSIVTGASVVMEIQSGTITCAMDWLNLTQA